MDYPLMIFGEKGSMLRFYVFSTLETGFYTLHDIWLFFKLETPETLKYFIFAFRKMKKLNFYCLLKMSFPPCFPTKLQNKKVKNACSMKIRVRRTVFNSFQRDSTSLND